MLQDVEYNTGHIYLLSIMDMYGKRHKIWGYGHERILLNSVHDLTHLESIFPHLPITAFQAMQERKVDNLVGVNMNHIMCEGSTGVDKKDGIKVKRGKFGVGWVVGGVLEGDYQGGESASPGLINSVLPTAAGSTLKPLTSLLTTKAAIVRFAKLLIVPDPALNPEFWEVKPTPKCDKCRKCQQVGEYSISHAQHTLKALAEMDQIKANTKPTTEEQQ